MWHVLFDYPKQELGVSFACAFHSSHVGEIMQFLGRDQTLEVSPQFCRTYLAEWKPEYQAKRSAAKEKASQLGVSADSVPVAPDYVFQDGELEVTSHMADFIECVRQHKRTCAPVEVAHRSTTLCNLGAISMLLRRKVVWDPVKEEFRNDPEANRLRSRAMRAPWTLAGV